MGYTPHQPAPRPGRPPVDAPRRYGRAACAAPPSCTAGLQPEGPGRRHLPPTRAVGFVVPAFYFILGFCLPSIAWSWGSNPEPCLPLLSAVRPRSPGSALRPSPPASRTRPAPPRTATARMAALPRAVCGSGDSSWLSGQQGAEWAREGGLSGAPHSGVECWRRGSTLEG